MRPSEVLDPKKIKTARHAVCLSQRETAKLVFPNSQEDTRLVTYQRIERTGKTSPQTAARIADRLKVAVDHLRPDEERANTLWWISHEVGGDEDDGNNKQPGIGATHDGADLFWGLECILKEYSLKFDQYGQRKIHARCDFDGDKFHIRIGRRTHCAGHGTEERGSSCSITIRSCGFDAQRGLLWCKADKILAEFIESGIKNLLFSHADSVVMNGKVFPPRGATACYHVAASKILLRDGNIVILRGEKSLTGRYEFIHSLTEWLHNNPGTSVNKMVNGLIIKRPSGLKAGRSNAKEPQEIDHQISVRYGWLDGQTGAFEEAPWPEYDRANLEAAKFVCLRPDWPAENDDAEVPTFEPELVEMGEQEADAIL